MKHFFLLIIFIFNLCIAFGQGRFDAEEAFSDARQYILSDEYNEAFYLLKQLADNGYNNANINYLSGLCCLNLNGKKPKAIAYLEQAVKEISADYKEGKLSETNAPPQAMYYLGIAYRCNGQVTKAVETFERILHELSLNQVTTNLINRELRYCKVAKDLISMPVGLHITKPGLAASAATDQYNPVVTSSENEMVYMSSRKFYDAILETNYNLTGWSASDEITTDLGSDGEFSVVSISSDAKILVMNTYDMYAGGELYYSIFNGQRWEKKQKFPEPINSGYSESYGSFSPDGKTFYFTSNRPGGKGGYDIYRSIQEPDGKWGPAINLGDEINSPEDEASPFVSSDANYLWFSSKGHYSMGGFDIFRSIIWADGFSYPQNAGFPLNTMDDDLFFVPVNKPNTGYIARTNNRENGNREIERLELDQFPNPHRFTVEVSVKTNDGKDIRDIGARLLYRGPATTYDILPDSTGLHLLVEEQASPVNIQAMAAGYNSDTKSFILPIDDKVSERHVDLLLEKILISTLNETISDSSDSSFVPQKTPYLLGAIYFPFESIQLNREAITRLDSLAGILKQHPAISLILTGYTDAQGPQEFNLILSEKRAKAVAHYLEEKDIDRSRIITTGKGEENQVTLDLNPETRKWNRRVEIQLHNTDSMNVIILPPPIPASYFIR